MKNRKRSQLMKEQWKKRLRSEIKDLWKNYDGRKDGGYLSSILEQCYDKLTNKELGILAKHLKTEQHWKEMFGIENKYLPY